MVSESAASDGDEGNVVNRPASKRNQGKVPKKIHKAEREKQKREHLNVLFVELRKAVEPTQPSSGKACIMNDTIRLLKELLAQLDCLKKENVALLSESQYVSSEKNELCEENSALQSQVEKLQSEIMERTSYHSSMNLNIFQSQSNVAASEVPDVHCGVPAIKDQSQPASIVNPFFIVPLHHDCQVYPQGAAGEVVPCSAVPSHVKRPRPRYPSPSDAWPSHILEGQLKESDATGQSSDSSVFSGTSNKVDLGLSTD